MIMRTPLLAVGLALALSSTLAAQELPLVDAGGVTTVVVSTDPAADSVHYRLTPAEGVRMFAPPEGSAPAGGESPVRLPFTFGLPANAPAGRFVLGTVRLGWSGDQQETRELAVDVRTRWSADLQVDTDPRTAPAGAETELSYGIENHGNAPDTFRITLTAPSGWSVAARPSEMVVQAGEQATGVVRVRVPAEARRGDEHQVRVTMEGTDVRETERARIIVVGEESLVGDLATIPGSIFVGSSVGRGGTAPEVALTARGEVRPGTRVSLAVRHVDAMTPAPAFRNALSGPRFQLSIDAPAWNARAGDVYSSSDLVTGVVTQGRGLEGSYTSGGLQTDVFLARPWSATQVGEEGHILRAASRYTTEYGTFGLQAASVTRTQDALGGYAHAGAALSYAYRAAGHNLNAEAGMVRVSDDTATTTGPAAELRYSFHGGRLSLATRLRKVPAATPRTASQGDEAFLSGSVELTDLVAITASAYRTAAPLVSGGPHATSEGGAAGLRLYLPGGINGRLSANYRANELVASGVPTSTTRSIRVGADIPVAGVILESDAEIGTSFRSAERAFRQARVGARWSSRNQWAWLGISHYDHGTGSPVTSLDLSGALRFHGAEIQAGLNTRLDDSDRLRTTTLWSGVTAPVNQETQLTAGMEFRGAATGSPWRLSLGASRSFGLPLPLKRAPVVQGVVFEDMDGDGLRGAGEPVLSGLDVTLGAMRATTDEEGAFRFYENVSGELRLDRSGLPLGLTVPAGIDLPNRGRTGIPVIRTASVELRLFLDRNGNERLEQLEDFAAGALVALEHEDGVTRDAVADGGGRVRFDGLPAGSYTVTIDPPRGRNSRPVELEIVLHPGAAEQRTVAIPLRSMEIRMQNGAPLDLSAAGAGEPVKATPEPVTTAPEPLEATPEPVKATDEPLEAATGRHAAADSLPVVSASTGADSDQVRAAMTRRMPSVPVVTREALGAGTARIPSGLWVALVLLLPGMAALALRHSIGRETLAAGVVLPISRATT